MKYLLQLLIITPCLLLLLNCSLAPKYQPPPVEAAESYKETGDWVHAEPASAALDRGPWWEMYDDPMLNALEEQVVSANKNIEAALARFDEARAALDVQRSALYPSLLGVFNAVRQQTSRNVPNQLRHPLFTDILLSTHLQYEVDVWGRVRNSVANAKSLAEASAADLAVIDLSMHTELANDYFTLRGDDALQLVLDRTVEMYARAFELTKNRFVGGAVPVSDLDQAQNQLETAKTLAEDNRLKRAQLEHAIAVLTGKNPSNFTLEPAIVKPSWVTINPELPSTLLERRPDIAEAELKVRAANYNIGVARAAFFPQFNLSAAIGVESKSLSGLFSGRSLVWALGPTTASALLNNGSMPLVTQTIYDGGKLIALTHEAYAEYLETVANYQQTVLTAYQEVEDNLVAIYQLDQENATQTIATAAALRATQQAMFRYHGGLTTYLEVVVYESLSLQAEINSIDIETRRHIASVQLIKALGGGFERVEEED